MIKYYVSGSGDDACIEKVEVISIHTLDDGFKNILYKDNMGICYQYVEKHTQRFFDTFQEAKECLKDMHIAEVSRLDKLREQALSRYWEAQYLQEEDL